MAGVIVSAEYGKAGVGHKGKTQRKGRTGYPARPNYLVGEIA
jgi:hypothetical protein